MSRDGYNRPQSKYWWKEIEQYDPLIELRDSKWGTPEYMLWLGSRLPKEPLKRGLNRRMRSAIGKHNPHRIWYWEEFQPGTKHLAHRWERRVNKRQSIREQLTETD